MIDLSKSFEFFNPNIVKNRIHIIGCGSVGGCIAELLARFGIRNITLWDFDRVESHNIVNQVYRSTDIGSLKVEALRDILCEIDPEMKTTIQIKPDGWHGERLAGYVFLACDSMEVRRQIVQKVAESSYVKAMFDFRTRLTDAQHFACDCDDRQQIENFLKTMDFTDEEAAASTPVSACGITLGVAPTVRDIVTKGVCNFVNFLRGNGLRKMIISSPFDFEEIVC